MTTLTCTTCPRTIDVDGEGVGPDLAPALRPLLNAKRRGWQTTPNRCKACVKKMNAAERAKAAPKTTATVETAARTKKASPPPTDGKAETRAAARKLGADRAKSERRAA